MVRHLPAVDTNTELVVFVAPWNQSLFAPLGPRVREVVCPVPSGSFVARAVWEQTHLPRLVREARLDVLHAPVNVAPLQVRCPVVLTLHEAEPFMRTTSMPAVLRLYWRLLRSASARKARRIVTVSDAARDELVRYMRVPRSRLSVVRHGVDVDRFTPAPDGRRGEHLLWVGRAYPRKNLPRLVDAYASLPVSVRQRHWLVLSGVDGWDSQRLLARVGAHAGVDTIRMTGRVTDAELVDAYRQARLFVFPSLHEAFGLPVLEALACGTPVLAADIPALREVGDDVVAYARPDHVADMADKMAQLLAGEAATERAREHGPQHARRFSWSSTAAQTSAVYAMAAA
ncbi:MAG: glycosyltransferase family 4 protein [Chloroflexi bacterium]|nr:glycosyltransferase family 4 protein [Chloroflexota bacterium]